MHLRGRQGRGMKASTEMPSRTSSCSIWPSLNINPVLAVLKVSVSASKSCR